MSSDQAATLALFAQVDAHGAPNTMRVLDRALILDADGYEAPLFSSDGRHLAIRGNAYENTLQVFEFPTLRQIFSTTLGEPYPGYPAPQNWQEQYQSWSRHNIAFAPHADTLWVGTPEGTVVELDLSTGQAIRRFVFHDAPVACLASTASGQLAVASRAGDLVLLEGPTVASPGAAEYALSARKRAAEFIDASEAIPADVDSYDRLEITDGARVWSEQDLDGTTTEATDPMWLRQRAHLNAMFEYRTPEESGPPESAPS